MNAPRPASVKHTPMTEEEIICTMALTRLPRVNTATQHRLVEELGSATAVFEHRRHIRDFFPEASDKLSAALAEMERLMPRAEEELEFARKNKIQCLCHADTGYPSRLRECDDAPLMLFYKGNADLNRAHVINMVGTRHCTEYGKDICRHFVAELARLCPDVLMAWTSTATAPHWTTGWTRWACWPTGWTRFIRACTATRPCRWCRTADCSRNS